MKPRVRGGRAGPRRSSCTGTSVAAGARATPSGRTGIRASRGAASIVSAGGEA